MIMDDPKKPPPSDAPTMVPETAKPRPEPSVAALTPVPPSASDSPTLVPVSKPAASAPANTRAIIYLTHK
jgi:hypothetical protein